MDSKILRQVDPADVQVVEVQTDNVSLCWIEYMTLDVKVAVVGEARRNPIDEPDPWLGQTLAFSRAYGKLSKELLKAAHERENENAAHAKRARLAKSDEVQIAAARELTESFRKKAQSAKSISSSPAPAKAKRRTPTKRRYSTL